MSHPEFENMEKERKGIEKLNKTKQKTKTKTKTKKQKQNKTKTT